MRQFVAILNPQADRGRAAQVAEALQQATRGRLALTFLYTTRRGEAVDLARNAAERDCEAVVAIGGDGTVHEVANGLMALPADQRPLLGVIPAGSGNDFAFAVGITGDFQQTLDTLHGGVTRSIDVGQVHSPAGSSRWFVNNIGTLLDGQVNLISHQLTWPRGSGLYVRALLTALLRRPAAAQLELHIDGTPVVRNAIVLSIGNGPRSGGKFHLLPDARIDDGRLDYLLAAPMGRLRLLWELHHSAHVGRAPDRRIERSRFSTMTVRSSIPLAAHVDGEPWLRPADDVHEIDIRSEPRALRVLCPGSV